MRIKRRYKSFDYQGLLGSFIVSWLLHCAMFAIAATTTIFYPPSSSREYISLDLFFASPGSGATDLPLQTIAHSPVLPFVKAETVNAAATDEPVPARPTQAEQAADLQLVTVKATEPEKTKLATTKIKPPPVTRPKAVKKPNAPPPNPVIVPPLETVPEAKKEEPDKPVAAEIAPPAEMAVQSQSLVQTDQEKVAIENEKIRRAREVELQAAQLTATEAAGTADLLRQEAERAARAEQDRLHRQQLAEQKAAQARLKAEARAAKIIRAAELEKQKAEKAAKARLAAVNNNQQSSAEVRSANAAAPARTATAQGITPAPAAHGEKPLSLSAATDKEKNQLVDQLQQKGFALPPVNGDIKLIITSEEDLIVKALFVSHPKARHDKPISKKEAKAQQKITPVVVRTAKNSLEAVIEHSREGIYIFLVEQKGSKPVPGKFSLKLFESKHKSVTDREISGQTEVARLLMPEGILWEEDSAFSGSIEDSESVTKFNSQTGLIWKEYQR